MLAIGMRAVRGSLRYSVTQENPQPRLLPSRHLPCWHGIRLPTQMSRLI